MLPTMSELSEATRAVVLEVQRLLGRQLTTQEATRLADLLADVVVIASIHTPATGAQVPAPRDT
jgi:hypothetical protein